MIGISYDSVDDLKSFSDKHKISYPLLSDAGSEVIKKYGILNTKDDSGIPNPGIYIIDKDLKVERMVHLTVFIYIVAGIYNGFF